MHGYKNKKLVPGRGNFPDDPVSRRLSLSFSMNTGFESFPNRQLPDFEGLKEQFYQSHIYRWQVTLCMMR
jgi:hypothetical protein